jgi:hypothetical protein
VKDREAIEELTPPTPFTAHNIVLDDGSQTKPDAASPRHPNRGMFLGLKDQAKG